jgi:hypothetical protein
MASTRLRSAPPSASSSDEEASLAPLPEAASLAELRDAMGSPGVIQAEVDGLLRALARPLDGDETPRARADFLLSLMELSGEAGERAGSNGRTVRAAAVEALLDLGYPYALEVPPDVLERVRREHPRKGREGRGIPVPSWLPDVVVTLLGLLGQFFLVLLAVFRVSALLQKPVLITLLGLVGLPPLLALIGLGAKHRGLQRLGAWGMRLQGLGWLGFALMEAWRPYGFNEFVLLLPWYLPLLAGFLMTPKKPS